MDSLLTDAAADLLDHACPPALLRALLDPAAAPPEPWQRIVDSGFLDALLPEAEGGAGLDLAGILPLLLACGGHAMPLPVGATILARAAFARQGLTPPEGAITLAQPMAAPSPAALLPAPHLAAQVLLCGTEGGALLLPAAAARVTPLGGGLSRLDWDGAVAGRRLEDGADWRVAGAFLEAVEMAGALRRVLEDTLRYAGERRQFGRAIGAFQAIQQQLSVLAEESAAGLIAAQLAATGPWPDPLRTAAAKIRLGQAAARAMAIAHAVHGAMGITEEHDLHLFTLRLQRGRAAFGGEAFWSERLGRAALRETGDSLGFVRRCLDPVA